MPVWVIHTQPGPSCRVSMDARGRVQYSSKSFQIEYTERGRMHGVNRTGLLTAWFIAFLLAGPAQRALLYLRTRLVSVPG